MSAADYDVDSHAYNFSVAGASRQPESADGGEEAARVIGGSVSVCLQLYDRYYDDVIVA